MVGDTEDKNTNNLSGWCRSMDIGIDDPTKVKSWEVVAGGKMV